VSEHANITRARDFLRSLPNVWANGVLTDDDRDLTIERFIHMETGCEFVLMHGAKWFDVLVSADTRDNWEVVEQRVRAALSRFVADRNGEDLHAI
jgi:hypothetical protein